MPVFDQRNQTVTYQYNLANNINLEEAETLAQLVEELNKLKLEVETAKRENAIGTEATEVTYELQKAIDQMEGASPQKKTVLDHLSKARGFIKGIVDAGGLVTGITKAMELAQSLL